MDATEITNNEYRQFVWWTRDSIAQSNMGYVKSVDGVDMVDWKKASTINGATKSTIEKIDQMIVTPENRLFGRRNSMPARSSTSLKIST